MGPASGKYVQKYPLTGETGQAVCCKRRACWEGCVAVRSPIGQKTCKEAKNRKTRCSQIKRCIAQQNALAFRVIYTNSVCCKRCFPRAVLAEGRQETVSLWCDGRILAVDSTPKERAPIQTTDWSVSNKGVSVRRLPLLPYAALMYVRTCHHSPQETWRAMLWGAGASFFTISA